MMFDNEEAVQHSETKRGNGKEVERGNHLAVVLEECQPALDLRLIGQAFQSVQITRDGRFRDIEPELQQFAVDARRAPAWILRLYPRINC